jgi:hypothetical protein
LKKLETFRDFGWASSILQNDYVHATDTMEQDSKNTEAYWRKNVDGRSAARAGMVLKKQRERVKEGVIPARTISDRKQGLQCAPPQAAEQIGSCGDPTTSPALSALKKPTISLRFLSKTLLMGTIL